MAVVNEVITEFGFDGSIAPLTDYNDALGTSIGLLATMAAGIVAAGAAVATFATSTTAALDPVIQLSRTTGVAVEAIQELGYTASVTGSDAATLESTIGSLTDKIGEAAQRGSEDFARLGINVRDMNGEVKTADRVLLEVGERFKDLNLSLSERRSMAASLGIDASLVQMLGLTGKALDETRAKARALGVVTTEQADAAASLNDSMTTLRFGLNAVKNQLAVSLAPQLEDITGGFIDFLTANKDVVEEGLNRVIEIAAATAKALVRLTPVIATLTAGFVAWKVASLGVATVMGTIFSPVVLITAGVAALLLVVDDLIVAFEGGQSVIADFFQEFLGVDIVPYLQSAVDAAVALFEGAKASVGATIDALTSILSGFFSLITGDVEGAEASFSSAAGLILDSWSNLFSGLVNGLEALFGFDVVGEAAQMAADLTDPIRSAFTSLFKWITDGFSAVSDAAGAVADFFGFGEDEERTPDSVDRVIDSIPGMTVDERQTPGSVDRTIDSIPGMTVDERQTPDSVDRTIDSIPGMTVDDQETDRVVNVRDLVAVTPARVPERTTADDQETDRVVNVRDLVRVDPAEVPPPEVSPVRALRDVSVLDSLSVATSEAAFPYAPESTPLGGQPVFSERLTPQPITNNSTENSRTVSVEQNNTFTISGSDPRSVADSITDRLQDQLEDARTQTTLGAF